MTYHIDWLIEDRIIYFYMADNHSLTDMHAVDGEMLTLLNNSTAEQVHIVLDDSDLDKMPGFAETRKLQYMKHTRLSWLFPCSDKPMQRLIGGLLGHVTKLKFKFVENPQEAIRLLIGIENEVDKLDEWQVILTDKQQQTRAMFNKVPLPSDI